MNKHECAAQVLQGCTHRPGREGRAFAPANIALCKYWGKRDTELNLPVTDSCSISLGAFGATTSIQPAASDFLILNGKDIATNTQEFQRVFSFVDLLRPDSMPLRIESDSGIPLAAGLASSASGFAALTLALNDFFAWGLDARRLSLLARLGSGSACRSIEPGFSHWRRGERDDGMDSFATRIDSHWPDLRIGFLLLDAGTKPIGSREAMRRTVETSTLYQTWPKQVDQDLRRILEAIQARDLEQLGQSAEENAMAMHATMLSARPSVLYWKPETVATLQRVHALRAEGCPVYATMDAGPNVKLLFEERDSEEIKTMFPALFMANPWEPPAN